MEMQSNIIELTDTSDFKKIINNESTKNNLYIIDFHARWCGPCKKIAPKYNELSMKYNNIIFLKCNVDEAEELSDIFDINSLPTFVIGYHKNIIEKFEGANMKHVEASLKKYLKMEDRMFQLKDDVQDSGNEVEEQDNAVEEQDDVVEQKDAVVQQHDDEVQQHDDEVQQHDDVVQQHDDVVQQHDDEVEQHDDVVQQHDDEVQQHYDEVQQHDDEVENLNLRKLKDRCKDITKNLRSVEAENKKLRKLLESVVSKYNKL